MRRPEDRAGQLQAVFEDIARTRMQGLPLCHPTLRVQTVGFGDWQGCALGVLITPWSMNLVLLPGKDDDWGSLQLGHKCCHQLPSGPYEFVVGSEPGIGPFQLCSLFSPMFDFADQDTVVATATAVMAALFDADNCDPLQCHEDEIARRWRGEPVADNAAATRQSPGLKQRLEQPMSRRALLRGNFLRGDER